MTMMNARGSQMMRGLMGCLESFHEDEEGATATEYIILLILIACFVIAIVKIYGVTVSRKFQAADELVRKEVNY